MIGYFLKHPLVSLRPESYPPLEDYSEHVETHRAAFVKAMSDYPTLRTILRDAAGKTVDEVHQYLWDNEGNYTDVELIPSADPALVQALKERQPSMVINMVDLSRVRHLNTMLNSINEALTPGGCMLCHTRTSGYQQAQIMSAHPGWGGRIRYFFHFLWHRMMARAKLTRWFYMWVTKGTNRSFPRVEVLGRMCRAGFDVIFERFFDGEFCLLAKKSRAPIWDDDPTNGVLAKLPRVGYQGNTIGVYKMRTMYPYSEYLQPYMYEVHGLGREGKFAHDFRVNYLGRHIRGTWVDELPMLINLLKGDIKLVGVRPLSRHYLSLYTPEMQQLHISVKPGLLPPYYYEKETPSGLEEVQESERRYIEAWREHPLATDWRYFWGIVINILFRHKRSK